MGIEAFSETLSIAAGDVRLTGDLVAPEAARGLIIFSHGSGSSRLSTRNRYVASHLQRSGFATLLFDLLTEEEDQYRENRFNIPLLTSRLVDVVQWAGQQVRIRSLGIGLFGASTGAASALGAAADLGKEAVRAVVSRGGRPDLAGNALPQVQSPTLLIVGGFDEEVLALNKQAQAKLLCESKLEVVPGATHLFEEPGTLETVAHLAADWFSAYMGPINNIP